MGPGLITGAADDDPSGIATYSQAGSQFRFALVWTLLLTTPLMIAVQLVSARIGWVTGRGLAANMGRLCPRWLTVGLVAALVLANTLNIAADITAMADATRLLVHGPQAVWVIGYGLVSVAAQVFFSYERIVRILKFLTLALFAYVAVVLAIRVPWWRLAREAVQPWAFLDGASLHDYAALVVAMLGTTISPYLFFWQATQEAEDLKRHPVPERTRHDPARAASRLRAIRQDTVIGMAFSNLVALCIVVSAAVTLNLAGHTDVRSSAEAAQALRPVAGDFAFAIFAIGIVGTGLLAVPVLAGSAAYAVSEVLGWPGDLSARLQDARGFYAIIVAAMVLGTGLSVVEVDAIKALVWSAVVNGVIAVPVMAVMLLIGQSPRIMGRLTIGRRVRALGWIATVLMGAAALVMFATLLG